jgi:hypothetical protein
MKPPARTLAVAVALAALTVLPAGTAAHARLADEPSQRVAEQQASEDNTYPTPIHRGPHAAQRTLAREHLAYPAPINPRSQAAELALIRTLGREHLAVPTASGQHADGIQPGQPSRPHAVVAVSGAVVLTVILGAAATLLWRRSRTRPREAT